MGHRKLRGRKIERTQAEIKTKEEGIAMQKLSFGQSSKDDAEGLSLGCRERGCS